MKRLVFIILIVAACGRGRSPEGQEPGDCNDGKDNDLDGTYDCDDDGCSMETVCVNLARQAEQAAKAAQKLAAAQKSPKKKPEAAKEVSLEPVFYVDGLMVQTLQNGEDINWMGAKTYCQNLNLGQHTDWRLPTSEEAVKIVLSGQLKNEESYVMWTSTEKGKKRAVIVGMSGAVNDLAAHYKGECRARCVRGAITK
jgi:hypothetical protein